jgi:hypothetical protein
MSRILIGSSNVYRHYRASAFKQYKEYSLVRCVTFDTLDAHLSNLEASQTEVIVSVLENLLEQAGVSVDPAKRRDELENITKELLKVVEDAAVKNPGTKFVLVEPILRPKVKWYDAELDGIKKAQKEEIKKMKVINVFSVDVISRASQQFEGDGVHLTKTSGRIFVEGILDAAESVFRASFVDLEDREDGDHEEEDEESGDRNNAAPTSNHAQTLDQRLGKLEHEIDKRRWNDNLLFARTREELDTATNKTKEDRIIITGLTSSTPPPREKVQKSQWIRKIVADTLKKIKPDFDGKIGFVNQGKNNGREIPMVEVKLDSVEAASTMRKAFADKRKEGDGTTLGRLYVANSVTLSTRVRIEVMKAIAKKLTTKSESAHVAAFSSRPILHVKTQKHGGEPEVRAFTFIDSVIRYGEILVQGDLAEAYKKAGTAFRGQLEQHFVVMNEAQPYQTFNSSGPSTTSAKPNSGKRPREEEQSTSSGKGSKNRKT